MEFDAFLALALRVVPEEVGRNGKRGDGRAIGGLAYVRVAGDVSDDHRFIQVHIVVAAGKGSGLIMSNVKSGAKGSAADLEQVARVDDLVQLLVEIFQFGAVVVGAFFRGWSLGFLAGGDLNGNFGFLFQFRRGLQVLLDDLMAQDVVRQAQTVRNFDKLRAVDVELDEVIITMAEAVNLVGELALAPVFL